MLILRGEIAKQREKKASQQIRQDLQAILSEWNWKNKPFTTAQDFLTKMKPWIAERIKQQEEVKEFLKKWKIKQLSDVKGVTTLKEVTK